jgi:integrase
MPVTDITPERLEDFIEAKRAPGGSVRRTGKALSDASLRTGLLALRLILQRAVRTKVLAANPMKEVEWRGAPRIEQVDPFTGAELRALLRAADELDRDFATLLRLWVQTGMCAGEVAGLQWQDVDLERGTALVRRTWSRQQLGPTKRATSARSRCSIRWLPRPRTGGLGRLLTRWGCSLGCEGSRCGPWSRKASSSVVGDGPWPRWRSTALGGASC